MWLKQNEVLVRLLLLGAGLHLLFSIWPEIDLIVSDAFRFGTDGFPLRENATLAFLRSFIWNLALLSIGLLALLAVVQILRGAKLMQWTCPMLQTTVFFLLGPGLLVNGILKNGFGRLRPADVVELGGDGPFTQVFHMAGSCTRNCSFVSGEAAMAMSLALVLWYLARRVGIQGPKLAWALTALVVIASLMRVATGRHFLSDVLFACLFMAILAQILLRDREVARFVAQALVKLRGLLASASQFSKGLAITTFLKAERVFAVCCTAFVHFLQQRQ